VSVLEQIVVLEGLLVLFQFWLWLYLLGRTGKRWQQLEKRVANLEEKA
jgi:hypothetical protein